MSKTLKKSQEKVKENEKLQSKIKVLEKVQA